MSYVRSLIGIDYEDKCSMFVHWQLWVASGTGAIHKIRNLWVALYRLKNVGVFQGLIWASLNTRGSHWEGIRSGNACHLLWLCGLWSSHSPQAEYCHCLSEVQMGNLQTWPFSSVPHWASGACMHVLIYMLWPSTLPWWLRRNSGGDPDHH